MAATAAERWGLTPRFAHLESTSVHVDGRDHRAHAPDDQVVHITRGYRRDHRPDLHHVMLEWRVEHQAGLPGLMTPLSGKSRDAPACGHVVRAHMAPLHTPYGTPSLGADSAL